MQTTVQLVPEDARMTSMHPEALGAATDGNVTFLYDQPVTSITITLSAGPDVATPVEQRVGVSSLAFDSFYR